jgi:hypothetical protein
MTTDVASNSMTRGTVMASKRQYSPVALSPESHGDETPHDFKIECGGAGRYIQRRCQLVASYGVGHRRINQYGAIVG